MNNFKYTIGIFVSCFILCSVSASPTDTLQKKEFEYYRLLPGEIKYVGATDFSKYQHGLTVSKLILGVTGKHGLSGDGFNSVFELGISYNLLARNNYIAIFPQFAQITWWGARWYGRAEPFFNLKTTKIDYINLEVGGGLFGSFSLFCLLPTNNYVDYLFGFKLGFDVPTHLFFKDGKNGWD
ncbi:MAG: hypothetical protein PHQ74_03835 [Crocinitomicaceae bacterium]|nr:hypothetical protein [Crocinitomicaceae bacterium]